MAKKIYKNTRVWYGVVVNSVSGDITERGFIGETDKTLIMVTKTMLGKHQVERKKGWRIWLPTKEEAVTLSNTYIHNFIHWKISKIEELQNYNPAQDIAKLRADIANLKVKLLEMGE